MTNQDLPLQRLTPILDVERQIDLRFPPVVANDAMRISILPAEGQACIRNTGAIFPVVYSRLELPYGCYRLTQHSQLTGPAPCHLEITMLNEQGGAKPIHLPPLLAEQLLKYLVEGPPTGLDYPFECTAFTHMLHRLPYRPGVLDGSRWHIADKSPDTEHLCGVTVAFGHRQPGAASSDGAFSPIRSIEHMGIALGHGLYLSKLGQGGLIVARLDAMLKGFECKSTWSLLPKKPLII